VVVVVVVVVIVVVAGAEKGRQGKTSALALARGITEALKISAWGKKNVTLTGQSQLISPVSSL
jgi:hypothetical protein